MEKNFREIYDKIGKSKKLNFLKQLLLKDSDLQQQFIEFTTNKVSSLDAITAINIDELRDELWNKISAIDVEDEIGGCYYDYYDDEGMGDTILEKIFDPFVNKALEFIDKGNYLDAFRSILAIYELRTLEEPDVYDGNFYVFGEDIDSYIDEFISSSIASFNSKIAHRVLSIEVVESLITLFFERYLIYQDYDGEEQKYGYYMPQFEQLFDYIIDEPQNAKFLLEKLRELKSDDYLNSANIILHCSEILGDDELYLKVANESFTNDKQVALKLQKKYILLGESSELARVSKILLEKEHSVDYTPFVIDSIDKERYQELYIKALEIYIKARHSLKHYRLLREYYSEKERMEFIKRFSNLFYIELLEEEKQYKSILSFAKRNGNSYNLYQIVKPIISVYPDEVFELLTARSDKLVEERGRSSYARACELLQSASTIPMKKEALKSYVYKLTSNNRRLSALRDEFGKAGLL